jgi:hypothetical protein
MVGLSTVPCCDEPSSAHTDNNHNNIHFINPTLGKFILSPRETIEAVSTETTNNTKDQYRPEKIKLQSSEIQDQAVTTEITNKNKTIKERP